MGRNERLDGCERVFTEQNPAAPCYFGKCPNVLFCTDCAEGRKPAKKSEKNKEVIDPKGISVRLGRQQTWFCSENCVEAYNRDAEEENEEADRREARNRP